MRHLTRQMIIGFTVASFIVPVFAFAQTTDTDLSSLIQKLESQILELQSKIKALKSDLEVVKAEIAFTKNLRKGEESEEVKNLQQFLSQFPDIYPEGRITGFYGLLTEEAIKRFQAKHGIITSGDPTTTGYGLVGPKTRAKLNELAGSATSTPATAEGKLTVCHVPPGEPQNKQTIDISQSALDAHLAHGDTVGACPLPQPSTPPPPSSATTTPATPAVPATIAPPTGTATTTPAIPATPAVPPTATSTAIILSAPVLKAALSTDGRSVTLTWNNVLNEDIYRIYRKVEGGFDWTLAVNLAADTITYTERPLLAIYEYYIDACTASGICSQPSNTVNVNLLTAKVTVTSTPITTTTTTTATTTIITTTTVTTATTTLPDLIIYSYTVSPSSPTVNQQVTLTFIVKNTGAGSVNTGAYTVGAIPELNVGLWSVAGSSGHSGLTLVSNGCSANLAVGASCTITYTVTYTISGAKAMTVIVDPLNQIKESFEDFASNYLKVSSFTTVADVSTATAATTTTGTTSSGLYGSKEVWNGSGYGVLWRTTEYRSGETEIYFSRLDANRAKIGQDLLVSKGHITAGSDYAIAWNGTNNEYAVVWGDYWGNVPLHSNSGTSYTTYFSRINAQGQKIGSDTQIEKGGDYKQMFLFWSGSDYDLFGIGSYLVSIYDYNSKIYFNNIAADGLAVGNRIAVSQTGKSISEYSAIWNGTAYDLKWKDYNSLWYSATVSSSGTVSSIVTASATTLLPDLIISDHRITSQASTGIFVANLTVKNVGSGPVTGGLMPAIRDQTTNYCPTNMGPGVYCTVIVDHSGGQTAGFTSVQKEVDYGHLITESDENNNTYSFNVAVSTATTTGTTSTGGSTTALTLSNVRAENITDFSAKVRWTTNRLSSSQVWYDLTNREPGGNDTSSIIRCDAGGDVVDHCVDVRELAASKVYYYRAYSAEPGSSGLSGAYIGQFTTASPALPQVQGLTATVSGTSVNLSWQAAPGISHYNIHRGSSADFTPLAPPDPGVTSLNSNLVAGGNVLAYTDSGLSAGTYYYKVVAQDVSGNRGPASAAAGAVVSASSASCTSLTITLANGKTTYIIGETVSATYACPTGTIGNFYGQTVWPDGRIFSGGPYTASPQTTLNYYLDSRPLGIYTLRGCFDANCQTVAVSLQFTIASSTTSSASKETKLSFTARENLSSIVNSLENILEQFRGLLRR